MAPLSAACVCLLAVFWWTGEPMEAFNIDLHSVRTYNSATPNSYFGYTVELFINSTGKWVIVGSPTAQPRLAPKVNSSGAVYRCSVEQDGGCEEIWIDRTGNRIYRQPGTVYKDLKEGQFLGASLAVSYDTNPVLVACAPLWINAGHPGFYLNQGMCYRVDGGVVQELRPLLETAYQNSRGYAFGQAGFSVTFAKEKTESKEKMVCGAPGLNLGRGGFVAYEDRSKADEVVAGRVGYSTYSYEGYSITSGKIYGPGKVSYILGAPRPTGQIRLYANSRYLKQDELSGQRFGEYFGASVCAVDFNGDRLDEVVVGAPLFSSSEYEDVGRVYVYPNQGKGKGLSRSPVILNSPVNRAARFGHAVAGIGDVNRDGYEDLAVGAPHENDFSGAIYIFNGGTDGVIADASQRIGGKSISSGLQNFGWSISRGQDMDGNGYPDFAVGAYQSDNAVLFLSRPVVKIEGHLTTVPAQMNAISSAQITLSVVLCLSYSGEQLPENLSVKLTLRADTYRKAARKFVRAKFDTPQGLADTLTEQILLTANLKLCQNISANVTLDSDRLSPIQFEAEFELAQKARNRYDPPPPMLDLSQNTHLSAKTGFHTNCGNDNKCVTDMQVKIEKIYLGGSNQLIIGKTLSLTLQVSVNNIGEPAYEAMLKITLPARVTYVSGGKDLGPVIYLPATRTLTSDIGNPLGPGRSVTLNFKLSLEEVAEVTTHLQFSADVTSTSTELSHTSADNHHSSRIIAKYDVNLILESQSHPEQFTYSSAEEDDVLPVMNVTQTLSLKNTGPSLLPGAEVTILIPAKDPDGSVIYLSPSEVQVVMWNETAADSEPVSCTVSDSYHLPSGQLLKMETFEIPSAAETASGNVTEVLGAILEETPAPRIMSPQQLTQVNNSQARRGHQMTLSMETHQCMVFTCHVSQLRAGQTVGVNVSFRASQAVLSNLKRGMAVQLNSSAFVKRISKPGFPSLLDDRLLETTISTLFFPSAPPQEQLPLWAIILIVVAALLLLLLIAVILARFGFFRRKKHAEVQDWKRKSGYSRRSQRPVSRSSAAAT